MQKIIESYFQDASTVLANGIYLFVLVQGEQSEEEREALRLRLACREWNAALPQGMWAVSKWTHGCEKVSVHEETAQKWAEIERTDAARRFYRRAYAKARRHGAGRQASHKSAMAFMAKTTGIQSLVVIPTNEEVGMKTGNYNTGFNPSLGWGLNR